MFNRTPVSGSRSTRLSIAVAAGALILLVTATGVVAGNGDQSTSSTGTSTIPGSARATRVSPDPTVVNLHRTAWDHVRVSADGKRLVVYFWMGVQDCYGLGKVNVVRQAGQLKIKLFTGSRPDANGMACIDIAQMYKTVIHLERPIFTSAFR